MCALFFTAAFAACMSVITQALADNNTVEIRAVAVCKDGKCVMAEEDFKKLQAFISQTRAIVEHNNAIEAEVNERLNGLAGALENCKDAQRKWKTNDRG
jgi:Na+/pantothenate symporter